MLRTKDSARHRTVVVVGTVMTMAAVVEGPNMQLGRAYAD